MCTREREREREADRQTDRQSDRDRVCPNSAAAGLFLLSCLSEWDEIDTRVATVIGSVL